MKLLLQNDCVNSIHHRLLIHFSHSKITYAIQIFGGFAVLLQFFIIILPHKQNLGNHACHVRLTSVKFGLRLGCILLLNWNVNTVTGFNPMSALYSSPPSGR